MTPNVPEYVRLQPAITWMSYEILNKKFILKYEGSIKNIHVQFPYKQA